MAEHFVKALLVDCHFDRPSQLQARTLSRLLEVSQRDKVVQGPNGTGKTTTSGLAILHRCACMPRRVTCCHRCALCVCFIARVRGGMCPMRLAAARVLAAASSPALAALVIARCLLQKAFTALCMHIGTSHC